MIELPENFDSVFRYIVVVSQRAEQLVTGAKARAETRHGKHTLQAKAEVDAGLVPWRILTQEELDAQRQAIVDQFRAEVGVDELAEREGPVPDVLPTGARRVEAPPEEGERDEEIDRLQRLLGMVGGGVGPDEEPVGDEQEEPDAASVGDALDLDEEDVVSTDDLDEGGGDGEDDEEEVLDLDDSDVARGEESDDESDEDGDDEEPKYQDYGDDDSSEEKEEED